MVKVINRVGRIEVARPNWRYGVQEEYTFKTQIITSYNGTEQRQALRQSARVALQYRSLLTAPAIRRHIADRASDDAAPFVLPTEWRRVKTVSVQPSANQIEVDEVPFWLVTGANIVVYNGDTEEAAVVDSVAGNIVTLDANLTIGVGVGATVSKAYMVRSPDNVTFRAHTSDLWEGNMRFDVDPASDPQAYPTAAPALFEGRELFLTRPNWREQPRIEFTENREVVDSSIGRIAAYAPQIDTTRVERMTYLGVGLDGADDLIAFFLRHKGRRTGFFMPSWQNDVAAVDTAIAGSDTFRVEGEDFANAYFGSKTYNVVIAYFADGSYQVNRIIDLTTAGGNSVALMRDTWTQNVTPETRMSFCHHWRFATDTLTVQWVSDRTAEIEFAVQTIQTEENA